MELSSDDDSSLTQVGIYGVSVATDISLVPRLPFRSGPPDLQAVAAEKSIDVTHRDPIYTTPTRENDAASPMHVYRVGDRFVLRFAGVAEFYIAHERIEYVLHNDTYAYALELWLLGTVLAFWLEWQGVPVLHASAAAVNGHAVGFMASKQGGKSSLALALLQRGYPLLTDDLLPVDVDDEAIRGRPGYPQMRLWADHAEHFVEDAEALRRAHPYIEKRRVPIGPDGLGSFCDDIRPLQALYLPERTDDTSIQIQPVAPTDALQAVLRHSFLPRIVEATSWQASRLSILSQLIEQVPVRRLTYPDGVEHLPRVADTILDVEA